ncbi:BnaA09g18070D [Brassica napus]|uniref:BnaA09g18070D protein n=1 Tax=Brassica napus TaxID=3708 RepID=A0A078H9Q0_BRANA|nr:BnaC03g34920D [Brassica napus]CDY32797.1 BnaA10g10520D [Brassica napus]CDY35170.1 BnaA09g18070D [Brassica napus]
MFYDFHVFFIFKFSDLRLMCCSLTYSDPGSSVTTTPISCSDQRCSWGVQSSNSGCSTQNNICAYTFQYGDGSCTSGFFVSDVLQFV